MEKEEIELLKKELNDIKSELNNIKFEYECLKSKVIGPNLFGCPG